MLTWMRLGAAFVLLAAVVHSDTVVTHSRVVRQDSSETLREKEAIKTKLEGAEARFRELLADLESFSSHATKAKADIHSSLLATWENVELLTRDRCGSELEAIRVSQRKAEAKVAELQDESRTASQQIEDLTLQLSKSNNAEASFKSEVTAERTRRESVEAEVHELRDKLHWASVTANETRAYDLVAERLESLLVVVTQRSQMLQRVLDMVTDHHSGFEDWRAEIDTLGKLVRDANEDFSGDLKSAASDALQRRVSDLERRLRDAQRARDDAVSERNSVRAAYDKVRVARSTSSDRNVYVSRERVGYQRSEGFGVVGIITACVMTALCGALMLLFCGWGSRAQVVVTEATAPIPPTPGSNAVTPDKSRGGMHLQSSPMTYMTGSATAQRSGGTPRRY